MTQTTASIKSLVRRPLRLSISWQVRCNGARYLREHLRAAHELLAPALAELSIAVVNDAEMTCLHDRFLQLSTTTDVLSFPLEVDERGRTTSGEVVICLGEARRQATERGREICEELLLYALHGMLHLCGFDDKTASTYRRMHRTEDQILRQLGVGAVFSAPPAFARSRRRAQGGTKRRP